MGPFLVLDPDLDGPSLATIFYKKSEKGDPKRHTKNYAEKYRKSIPKEYQNGAKIDAEICDFSCLFEKDEKCKIALPLQREHEFTRPGHLKMKIKSARNRHDINAKKNCAKSMENHIKMYP